MATGNYLWQVDIDEFYKPEDITAVLGMLREDPDITAISFKTNTVLGGGFDTVTDGWYLRLGAEQVHRIFRWGSGYRYTSHRPPTVVTADGVDTRRMKWLDARHMERLGIFLYHYSLVFPKHVKEKCEYYGNAEWVKREAAAHWAHTVFGHIQRPFRVHNVYEYPSWLERYEGTHPQQIEAMRLDIECKRLAV